MKLSLYSDDMKTRKPIPQKIKAVLQKEIGSVCPFCQNKDVDHFEFHHIDENPENNEVSNLLMLCPTCHSKITKGDITKEEVIKVKQRVSGELKPKLPKDIEELLKKAKDVRNDSKFSEAKEIYVEALKLSEKLNDGYSIAKCKLALADTLSIVKESSEEILQYLNDSEKYFRENNLDENLADTLFQLSLTKLRQEQFDDARINLFEALEINQRLNDKLGEAECYFQIGWMEHGQGHLDKSKEYYKKSIEIYEQEYTKHEKKVITNRIAESCIQLAIVNEAEGNISEADINLTKGLKYCRESEFKYSTGRALFHLAELKLRTQQIEIGLEYLNESLNIFSEIDEFRFLAKGLDLLGLFHYNFGDKKVGVELFYYAIAAIEKTDDVRGKLEYYTKLAELFKIEKKYDDAEKLYLQIIDVAEQESDDEYFHVIVGLVTLNKKQDKKKDAISFAKRGIKKLKEIHIKTQRESKRAETLGNIGALYLESENCIEAKKYFLLSKDAYTTIASKNGISKCVGSLAYIYRLEGDFKSEAEAYKELKQLTEGTHYYYEQAVAAFNLCMFEISNKNFEQAKKYFDEAEYLNYCYELNLDEKLDELDHRLDVFIESHQKPDRSIQELITDMYSLVNYYPKERIHLLRFWLFMHGNELFTAIRYEEGVKFFIVTDDTDKFINVCSSLNAYSNFFIQSNNNEGFSNGESIIFHYPDERLIPKGLQFLMVPKDQKLPDDLTNVEFSISKLSRKEFEENREDKSMFRQRSSGKLGRYTIFFVEKGEKKTYVEVAKKRGIIIEPYDGHIILGYPITFPKQFETLLLKSTADEILKKKVFFDLTDRSDYKDKFYSDLSFSKQLGCIPIFENQLPKSNRVSVIESISLEFPIYSNNGINGNMPEVRKIRNFILKHTKDINKNTSVLQNLKISIEELAEQNGLPKFYFDAYILELESFDENEKEKQVAFVFKGH